MRYQPGAIFDQRIVELFKGPLAFGGDIKILDGTIDKGAYRQKH